MAKPVLWHIPISHYNEKARWALEYKGVEHERRAPTPPAHMAVAMALTRGRQYTFPVLQLEGESIGDSTAIIAALERRFPQPPLYPPGEPDRRRALDLEHYFDEQLAPHVRLLVFHEVISDSASLQRFSSQMNPGLPRAAHRAAAAGFKSFLSLRFGVSSQEAAANARTSILSALERLEAELGEGDYLVGDAFTVADLTAAALFYPLVQPPEGPRLGADLPAEVERFLAPLKERPGYRWVQQMFRRHRHRGTALRPDPVAAPSAS